jgi:CheY-like chemotaxis protein
MATVLVIEDDESSLELVTALLERSGHDVLAATSAEEVDSLLRARLPALVLIDVCLPGLDGLALTRRLRADPATASLPIFVVTAHARPEDRTAAFEAGCTAWLTKPLDTRLFARTLSLLLR